MTPFHTLAITQHGFEIFSVLNPSGILQPGTNHELRLFFNPAEAKNYEVTLRILYQGISFLGASPSATTPPRRTMDNGSARRSNSPGSSDLEAQSTDREDSIIVTDGPQTELILKLEGRGYHPRLNNGIASLPEGIGNRGIVATRDGDTAFQGRLTILPMQPMVLPISRPPPVCSELFPQPMTGDGLAKYLGGGELKEEPTLLSLLSGALYGRSGPHDAFADSIMSILGLDSITAAVSTYFNPLEVVSSLLVDKEKTAARLFSGPDAGSAAAALIAFARSKRIVSSIEEMKTDADPGEPDWSYGHLAILPKPADSEHDQQYRLLMRSIAPSFLSAVYRPGTIPSTAFGASPPLCRWVSGLHSDAPEGMGKLSCEWLRFGDVPIRGVTHRVLVLRNMRSPDNGSEYSDAAGQLAYAWDAQHPLVVDGTVKIHPMSGLLMPGEAHVIRVTFTAPHNAQILDVDIGLTVSVSPKEQFDRAQSILNRLLKERFSYRRSKRNALPGASQTHVSVAEKTTVSRMMHLQTQVRDNSIKASRMLERSSKVVGDTSMTRSLINSTLSRVGRPIMKAGQAIVGNPIAPVVSISPSALANMQQQTIAQSNEAFSQSLVRSKGVRFDRMSGLPPSPIKNQSKQQAVTDPGLVVAAMLAGDTNVYEGAILENAEEVQAAYGDIKAVVPRVDMSLIPMPPPPHALHYLHISARVCGQDEFVNAYSPAHLAAFLPASLGEGEEYIQKSNEVEAEAVESKMERDPAVKSVFASLLADIVNDPEISAVLDDITGSNRALAVPVLAAGDAVATTNRDTKTQDFLAISKILNGGGIVFEDIRKALGDVVQASKLRLREYAMTADALTRQGTSESGRLVFDNSLPPPRSGVDTVIAREPAVAEALRDRNCRDFCVRIVESMMLQTTRELVQGDIDTCAILDEPISGPEGMNIMHFQPYNRLTQCAPPIDAISEVLEDLRDRANMPDPVYQAGADDDY
jgi:hypothetical protein